MKRAVFLSICLLALAWGQGNSMIRVTDFPNHELCPRVSPDGERLAYAEVNLSGNVPVANIRISTYDGSNPMLATNRGVDNQHPAWFPNSAQVAYERQVTVAPGVTNYEIWSVPINSLNGSRLVQNNNNFCCMPDISPKGDVVFVSSGNMTNPFPAFPPMRYGGIPPAAAAMSSFVIAVQPAGASVIINTVPGLYPRWDPSGTKVAYCAWNSSTNWDIFVADYVEGVGLSNFRQVTSDPGDEFAPAWSPDGNWIAYAYAPPGGAPPVNIFIVDVNKGTTIQETFENAVTSMPDWAKTPAGEFIYCESNIDGDFDIYRLRPLISTTSPSIPTPPTSPPPPGQMPPTITTGAGGGPKVPQIKVIVLNSSSNKSAPEAQGFADRVASFIAKWDTLVVVTGILNGADTGEPHVYYAQDTLKSYADKLALYLDGLVTSGVIETSVDFTFYPAEPLESSPYKVVDADIVVEAPAN